MEPAQGSASGAGHPGHPDIQNRGNPANYLTRANRHASLSTLLAEYEVLTREAQTDRWSSLLDVAPFPEDIYSPSPYYESLEAALARHEAAGHRAAVALTELAPGEHHADPAAQLATMLDRATQRLRPSKRARTRFAGLIPTPAAPIPDDMQIALTERQTLIEAAAGRLVDGGTECRSKLGLTTRQASDPAESANTVADTSGPVQSRPARIAAHQGEYSIR